MVSTGDELPQSPAGPVSTAGDEREGEPSPSQGPTAEDAMQYPSGLKVVLVMASVWLAFFFVALVSVDPC